METLDRQLAYLHEQMLGEEVKEQIVLELEGIERGVRNVRHAMQNEQTNLIDTEPGRHILNDMMYRLTPPIAEAKEEAIEGISNGGRGVKPTWFWFISTVPADKLAFISIRSILSQRMARNSLGRRASAICLEIGNCVKMQTEYELWAKASKRLNETDGTPDFAKLLMRRAKNMNARQFTGWRRRIDLLESLDWTREEKIHIGSKLLDLAIVHGGGYFELRYVQIRQKTERQIYLSPLWMAMMDDVTTMLEINSPVLRPMIVQPKPWKWNAREKRYDGGYYKIKLDLIRGGIHRHTADLDDPLSQETLDAVDAVGRSWWRINEKAFDLLVTSQSQATSLISSLPNSEPLAIPARKTDEEWDRMGKQERADWKYELSKIHSTNHKDQSKREAALRKIQIAKEMLASKFKRFTMPQKLDSRTRMYCANPDLNSQSDSIGKALLEFGVGEPLGPRGLYWMNVKLANTFGNDKITFDEMQTWASDHHDLIIDSANEPIDGHGFWRDADKELEFFATCVEYAQANQMDNPENFISYLPSHMDGSNNGLQLLSLLGRDPVGAKLTNCSASPIRHDIYQVTAVIVAQIVSDLASRGDLIAQRWAGNITRSVTKKSCMTTSYGVTPRGIQDQLIDDGHCEGLAGERLENAAFLRDHLIEALDQTIVASRPIMTYFQDVAVALAKIDRPMRWRTPTGSLVQQSYWSITKSDIKTVMGAYFMWTQNPDGGLNQRKQALASSPNVIHSLDASLLQRVVNQLVLRGIHQIATVHDSFAVHFRHTEEMRDVIRQEAYRMFKHNWLKDGFHDYVQSNSPIELPEPPSQGTFDVSEVLKSEYFFS